MKIRISIYLTIFSVAFFSNVIALAQDWTWAKVHSGNQNNEGKGIAVDANGNNYAIGSFFGSITFGDNELTSAGSDDVFITKHDADGNLIWAISAGGNNQDLGKAITVDSEGNVIVTGSFRDTAFFGTLSITTGGTGTFVVKFDPDGNAIWAKAGTTNDAVYGNGVDTDNEDNVYVTGYFLYDCEFDGVELSTPGFRDLYVVKYNSDGTLQWAKRSDGSFFVHSNAIATDAMGNSVITGYFTDNLIIASDTLDAPGNYGIFIARIDSDGNLLWGRQSGGNTTLFDEGLGVATDNAGNSYVSGAFHGTSAFGDVVLESEGLSSDVFLAAYDQNGNALWAHKAGSAGDDKGTSVSLDASANVYLTGSVGGAADFNGTPLPSLGNQDIFVAKYGSDGSFQWVQQAGGVSVDVALGVAADADGNCYVTGSFRNTATFGSHQINAVGSLSDVFVAKLGLSFTTDVEITDDSKLKVHVYPNPSSGLFQVVYSELGHRVQVSMYDMGGRQVLSQTIDGFGTIDAGHFNPGVYILVVESPVGMENQKVVIR